MPSTVLDIARCYVAAGLSIIPVGLDGNKQPAFDVLPRVPDPKQPGKTKSTWKPFEQRRATDEELVSWFGGERPYAIAVACGRLSGGAECIDFDEKVTARDFCRIVQAEEPILYKLLSLESTPRGLHVWYTTSAGEGNRVLAGRPDGFDENGKPKVKTIIETRGQSGYAIVAGSPLEVHELKLPYQHVAGPVLTALNRITNEDRDYLFRLAMSFERQDKRTAQAKQQKYEPGQLSPGDDYDLRGEPFSDLLPDAEFSHPERDEGNVRRPGKERGTSASVGHCRGARGEPLLKVFTSNWPPFEAGKCYGRFQVLRLVRFNGDGAAATKELRARGYGSPPSQSNRKNGTAPPVDGREGAADNDSELVFASVAGIVPEAVHFLVPGYIPSGMMGMLAGEGGHGKSMTTLELAAALSVGRCRFGLNYPDPIRGQTLLISCEDDWARTIVPRLAALGADRKNILRVEGVRMRKEGNVLEFHMGHFKELERALQANPGIKLIVIDPAGAYIGRAGVNENQDAELRAVLGPLSEVANRSGACALLIKHLNKSAGVSAVQRVGGSTGYVNAVRFAYMVAPDPNDPDKKLMLPIKANVLPSRTAGLAYRTEPIPIECATAMLAREWPDMTPDDLIALAKQLFRQAWEGGVEADVNEVAGGRQKRAAKEGDLEACAAFIREFLGEYAWPEEELEAAREKAGFTFTTYRNAKTKMRSVGKDNPAYLASRPISQAGAWWLWIGPQRDRPANRPGPLSVHHSNNTRESRQSSDSSETQVAGGDEYSGGADPELSLTSLTRGDTPSCKPARLADEGFVQGEL